jgi:hypothetical protein
VAAASNPKILVAVHGIGDQIGYETVQSVASRVATYLGVAPALPLGRFYPVTAGGVAVPKPAPQLMMDPPDPRQLVGFGFAEVYWAPIARQLVEAKYVLEEAKKWARTISGRVAIRAARSDDGGMLPPREQLRLVTVLDQLIETIFILERLTMVAEKAGLFKFNLRKLLVDFIGDVQLVADFAASRGSILQEFDSVMTSAAGLGGSRPADLYLVAHSEGTVLTFLSLVTALSDPARYPWISSVKGLMTIGSPIEIHHILWPELWRTPPPGTKPLAPAKGLTHSFPWHNYYDYGDPIAYELTETEKWMNETGVSNHMKLETHAFSRSHLPGKAHTDYWHDEELFGYFIESQVAPPAEGTPSRFPAPPRTKRVAQFTSYVLPNLIILLLLLAATYLFYTPVSGVLKPDGLPAWSVLRDVLGIGLLLLGVTAAGRLPRLTDTWWWWALAAGVLVLGMVAYANVTCADSRWALGRAFVGFASPADANERPLLELPVTFPCASDSSTTALAEVRAATKGTLLLAAFLALVSGVAASWSPYWGVRILPSVGALAAFALVAFLLWQPSTATDRNIAFWPIILGGAAFFYLWWLATLLFDLVFVWQRYIRHSAVRHRLSDLATHGYTPTKVEQIVTRMP